MSKETQKASADSAAVLLNAKEQAQELYLQGNAYRKKQMWAEAQNLYEKAAALDPESPAVAARAMLSEILAYRCKEYYNP